MTIDPQTATVNSDKKAAATTSDGGAYAAITSSIDALPFELKRQCRFLGHKITPRVGERWKKVPVHPRTGYPADYTDPANYTNFEQARAGMSQNPFNAVGIGLFLEDGITGVDLDECVDADGKINDDAQQIVDRINGYTEVSVSGTGVHIFVRATKPGARVKGGKFGDQSVEIYDQNRSIVITGNHVVGTPLTIEGRQHEISQLYAEVFGKAEDEAPPPETAGEATGTEEMGEFTLTSPEMTDEQIVIKASEAANGENFKEYWAGGWGDKPSASEADLGLCTILAFWTQDAAQIDRLFRKSGLCRSDKWTKRKDYRDGTIKKAIDFVGGEVFVGDEGLNAHFSGAFSSPKTGLREREGLSTHNALNAHLHTDNHTGGEDSNKNLLKHISPITPKEQEAQKGHTLEGWPTPMGKDAYHGVCGEIAHMIEPHTESDSCAILIQILVAVGNEFGREAYFQVEGTRHHTNINAVLVGESSKARKGTSFGQVANVLSLVDPKWREERGKSGMSSGEGLIWQVRDPIWKNEPIKKNGKPTGETEPVCVDEGVDDKRLLVLETEFSSPLRVMERDGNILSAVMREAWDTGHLQTLVKNSPAAATNAHISIIGHVTRPELRKDLNATNQANGFANRILWVCVRRSKLLPEGGDIGSVDFDAVTLRLGDAVNFAQSVGEVKRDDAARKLWRDGYPDLSEGRPGLVGAILSRSEAQVTRLSLIYALLDQSHVITPDHLRAALAVWNYCEESGLYIFGDAIGDPVADEILQLLRSKPEGRTRTEIYNYFGRHQNRSRIGSALEILVNRNLVERVSKPTAGRSTELWRIKGVGAQ